MKFAIRHADKLVGAFVIVGLLFLLGALAFVGVNRRWFQRDLEFRSRFLSAEGLRSGLALELRGFAIGRLESLRLGKDSQVEVVLSVYREYADRVLAGSVVELQVQPLGFGSRLFLLPGRAGGTPLPPGTLIPSTDFPEGRARVGRGDAERIERRDEVASLLETLPPLVSQVDSAVKTLDQLMARLDRTLMGGPDAPGGGLLGTVETTVAGLDGTSRQFGDLAARLAQTTADLGPVMDNVTAFSQRLANPEGLLPTLMGSEGSAGRFFRDDAQLYGQLNASLNELTAGLAEMRQLLAYFSRSTPEIGVLMDEATSALDESQKVMQGLKNNPLLRGGIQPERAPAGTFEGYRQEIR